MVNEGETSKKVSIDPNVDVVKIENEDDSQDKYEEQVEEPETDETNNEDSSVNGQEGGTDGTLEPQQANGESIGTADDVTNGQDAEESTAELKELLNKQDVFLYSVPNADFSSSRAADWSSNPPLWYGNLQVLSHGKTCVIKFEDVQEKLFGYAELKAYPTDKLVPAKDSQRFFLLKVIKDNSELNEPDVEDSMGLGFSDRKDSSDFILSIMNYLRTRKLRARNKKRRPNARKNISDHNKNTVGSEPPPAKIFKAGAVQTNSSHIVIKDGNVEAYIYQGLKRTAMFGCHLCKANFDDSRHIIAHWKLAHKIANSIPCTICLRPFPSEQKMLSHRISFHGFECPKPSCRKQFEDAEQFHIHCAECLMNKLFFKCSFCAKAFKFNRGLVSHLKVKHGNELFKCKQCPSINDILYLVEEEDNKEERKKLISRIRAKSNTNEYLYTKTELSRHIATLHNTFIFCHLCERGFRTESDLNFHFSSRHTDAIPLTLDGIIGC